MRPGCRASSRPKSQPGTPKRRLESHDKFVLHMQHKIVVTQTLGFGRRRAGEADISLLYEQLFCTRLRPMSHFRDSKLFTGLPEHEFNALERSIKSETYSAGQIIFAEGDRGNGLYLVQDGEVLISAMVNDQQRRALTRFGPGEFFGEMAVVDNEPRSATATAEQESHLCFIPRETMLGLLNTSPILAVNLVREFSLRLREFNRHYIREVLDTERLALVGRFARAIVHDFKNPLNVIGLAADMAREESSTPEMRQRAALRIRRHVERLSSMINELLEFTRGSQSTAVLAEVNYRTFATRMIDELRLEVGAGPVSLVVENEPPDISLLIDPNRLSHVFSNLAANAVDAMPGGGRVIFRFEARPHEVVTEIEDTGEGLAPEIVPRLFSAFATYGKAQGTGLGLSICRKIVEDHRGRIEARIESGRGAIFSFALPRPK